MTTVCVNFIRLVVVVTLTINDNENNFIVMNHIGTMTAVNRTQQVDISTLDLDIGIVF